MNKTAFIILGSPRSGTSAISHMIHKFGVDFGKPENFLDTQQYTHNPIFFELDWVNEYNNRLISSIGSKWENGGLWGRNINPDSKDFENDLILEIKQELYSLINQEWHGQENIGIKDPRFCFTFPVWQDVLFKMNYSLKIIFVFRHPLGYLNSTKKLNGFKNSKNLNFWLQHNLAARYFINNQDFYLIDYDCVICNPTIEAKKIASLLKLDINLVNVSASVIDKCYYHNVAIGETGNLVIDDCYRALKENNLSASRYITYKNIYSLFKEDISDLKHLVNQKEHQLQQTQGELEHSQSQLQDTQVQLEHSQSQLQDIQIQLEHSQSQLQDIQAQLEHSQSQLQDIQIQLKHSQSQLQDTQAQLECSQSQLQDTQAQLKRSQFQLQQTQMKLERSQSQLQDTQTQLEHSQGTILAMNTSKFWQMRKIWFKFRHIVGLLDDNPFDKSLGLKLRSVISLLGNYSSFHRTFFSRVKNSWTVLRTKGLRYCLNKLQEKTSSKLKFDDPSLPTIALPDIPKTNDINYQKWLNQNYPNQIALQKMGETAELLAYKPTISLIMPVFNTPACFLQEAIESVLNQVYPYWELCIADDYSTNNSVREILEDYSSKDSRIKVVFRTENGHISRCSNSAIEIATGEFLALLDHDDLLTPDALYEIALLLNKHPEADMIYSDEDKIDENCKLRDPFFKPDWCPDSFLSRMYTCHLGTYRRELVVAIGGFRIGYEGSQDYDLVLRLTEKTTKIFHIPKILYHWRIHSQSAASKPDQKPYAVKAAEKALVDALVRRGEHGRVTQARNLVGHYIIRYTIDDYKLVSIIIPTRDLGNVLDKCLTSIFEKTTYPNYEVILIDNGSQEENTANIISKWQQKESSKFRCYQLDIPFNYSKINNYAVNQANGDYLLFLNNDIELITPDWMNAMVEQAQRPSIGAVGALLLYPDNTIQHAGVIIGIGGVAGHSHKYYPAESAGYFDQILTANNYSAVTAACLMCRRETFEAIGGFEEELAVAFNDVDLCLKLVKLGYRNIYLPHVMLYHYESKSRGSDNTPAKLAIFIKEIEYMQKKWKNFIEYDPCYSINLTTKREDYSIKA
ncbi:MAG: glycosyltransferase [Nostoc sp.]